MSEHPRGNEFIHSLRMFTPILLLLLTTISTLFGTIITMKINFIGDQIVQTQALLYRHIDRQDIHEGLKQEVRILETKTESIVGDIVDLKKKDSSSSYLRNSFNQGQMNTP